MLHLHRSSRGLAGAREQHQSRCGLKWPYLDHAMGYRARRRGHELRGLLGAVRLDDGEACDGQIRAHERPGRIAHARVVVVAYLHGPLAALAAVGRFMHAWGTVRNIRTGSGAEAHPASRRDARRGLGRLPERRDDEELLLEEFDMHMLER